MKSIDTIISEMKEYAKVLDISFSELRDRVYNDTPSLMRTEDKLDTILAYWESG